MLPPATMFLNASAAPPPVALIVKVSVPPFVESVIPEPATKLRVSPVVSACIVSSPDTTIFPKACC